jgi:ankyrin repeat protein
MSALEWLIHAGDVLGIRNLLLEVYDYANHTDRDGNNALHWLCMYYKKFSTEDLGMIIYWLIDRHVDDKHKNNYDKTPLDVAVMMKDVTLAGLIATGGVRKDY